MLLYPDLWSLVRAYVGPKRSLAQHMCVAAFGRLQDDRSGEYEFSKRCMFREMSTHAGILFDCRRFGVDFGSMPTPRAIQQRMRLVEEIYLCLELEDERTRRGYAPKLPVFAYERVSRGRWGRAFAPSVHFGQLYLRAFCKASSIEQTVVWEDCDMRTFNIFGRNG